MTQLVHNKKIINYKKHNIPLFYPKEKDFFDTSDICNKIYDKIKKFNYLYIDFFDLFSKSIVLEIKKENKKIKNFYEKHKIIRDQNILKNDFQIIKKTANSNVSTTKDESIAYLKSFKNIYKKLNEEFKWKESDYFIAPLKGGGVIINLFELPGDSVLKLEAKRIPLKKNNNFGFGLHSTSKTSLEIQNFLKNTNNKEITILEICVATGMTTAAFLLDLYSKKIKPKKIKILASAISAQSIYFIQELSEDLGFNVEFITAKIVFKLGDYYNVGQDSLQYSDGKFVVKSPWDAYGKIADELFKKNDL